jgi:hypothetical protein
VITISREVLPEIRKGIAPHRHLTATRLRYSIIKKREKGSEGLGGRSTQRECGGEKQNDMRGARLQRSHDNGSLSSSTLDDW